MNIDFSPEQTAFREEIRAWLEAHVPEKRLPSLDTEEGFELHRDWERTLHKDNWGMVTWPKEYGGRGCDLIDWLIFEEEYYRADAPARVSQNGIFLLGPTIMEYGTEEQKSGFCQAWPPVRKSGRRPGLNPAPKATLPVSAARLCATAIIMSSPARKPGPPGPSLRIGASACSGQTGQQPPQGLVKILVPLDSDGLTIRPIAQLDGDPGFAELFFDEVRVPVDNLLGPEHGGWGVAMATAGFERGLLLRSPARFQSAAGRLVKLYKKHANRLSSGVKDQVMQAWIDTERFAAATYALVSQVNAGASISSESSANKIFWSEMDRHLHRTAMSIMGAQAELEEGLESIDGGRWLDGYMTPGRADLCRNQ